MTQTSFVCLAGVCLLLGAVVRKHARGARARLPPGGRRRSCRQPLGDAVRTRLIDLFLFLVCLFGPVCWALCCFFRGDILVFVLCMWWICLVLLRGAFYLPRRCRARNAGRRAGGLHNSQKNLHHACVGARLPRVAQRYKLAWRSH